MWCTVVLTASVLAAGGEAGTTGGSRGQTPEDAGAAAQARPAQDEPTPLFVLSRETSAAMRREAVAQDSAERARAIRALCELHRTLLTDVRYEQVEKLKELRGRVYSRLRRVQADLKRELARTEAAGQSEKNDAATLAAAQEAAEQDQAALAAADSLAGSLAVLNATAGGPQALVGFGGRGVQDNGQALVDLIERTINPAFWDTNGGPGAIVYFQPLQCLVVRASGDVHERLGGVVGGLRAAGR